MLYINKAKFSPEKSPALDL